MRCSYAHLPVRDHRELGTNGLYPTHLCGGDSFMVADTGIYLAGFYEWHYPTLADCDSVVQAIITAAPNPVTNLDLNICEGDTLGSAATPIPKRASTKRTYALGSIATAP
ncbi:MAG: hypothetical protein IPN76_18955 [Saprospiraceae bacterium]|nr:hypothetical protein [Saprospiraceae bacterium]